MGKKRGIVWNYFYKKISGAHITAFCKFCNQSYTQNATRMERHLEKCEKCPEKIRHQFLTATHNKRVKNFITMNLTQNGLSNQTLGNFTNWQGNNKVVEVEQQNPGFPQVDVKQEEESLSSADEPIKVTGK